jgi:hypothetical protein
VSLHVSVIHWHLQGSRLSNKSTSYTCICWYYIREWNSYNARCGTHKVHLHAVSLLVLYSLI